MILLSELLSDYILDEESEAAVQAKQMGLTSKGFGRWADQSGNITHKTDNGKLVPVDTPPRAGGIAQAPDATPTPSVPRRSAEMELGINLYAGNEDKLQVVVDKNLGAAKQKLRGLVAGMDNLTRQLEKDPDGQWAGRRRWDLKRTVGDIRLLGNAVKAASERELGITPDEY